MVFEILHDSDHLGLVWQCDLLLCSLQVTASCPAVCECPKEPLVCPPGVSTVPDGCGCCKVCAAQLNQDCSPMRPCDHHKVLECNYGNDVTMAWGICRGERRGEQYMLGGKEFHLENSCFLQLFTLLPCSCKPNGRFSIMDKVSYI